jgi:hypothetical protein
MGFVSMSGRLWYPQLDTYDAVRRIAGLLLFWEPSAMPSQERLYIADFYLANPPLLHKTHMAAEIRKQFNTLAVQRPEKSFVSYPSAPLLFQKMEEVQRQALQTLTGKGLIDVAALARGVVKPSGAGSSLFEDQFSPLFDNDERRLGQFIANSFARSEEIEALRRSTGLRRIAR